MAKLDYHHKIDVNGIYIVKSIHFKRHHINEEKKKFCKGIK